MAVVERSPGGSSLIDVLDRVLDKGIVIDAWVRVSLVGIDLITVEARVVVASIDTYLRYADALGLSPAVRQTPLGHGTGSIDSATQRPRQPPAEAGRGASARGGRVGRARDARADARRACARAGLRPRARPFVQR